MANGSRKRGARHEIADPCPRDVRKEDLNERAEHEHGHGAFGALARPDDEEAATGRRGRVGGRGVAVERLARGDREEPVRPDVRPADGRVAGVAGEAERIERDHPETLAGQDGSAEDGRRPAPPLREGGDVARLRLARLDAAPRADSGEATPDRR